MKRVVTECSPQTGITFPDDRGRMFVEASISGVASGASHVSQGLLAAAADRGIRVEHGKHLAGIVDAVLSRRPPETTHHPSRYNRSHRPGQAVPDARPPAAALARRIHPLLGDASYVISASARHGASMAMENAA